jgi:hypothetical protein
MKSSCIDYFLQRDAEITHPIVHQRFGKSDHYVVACQITGADPVLRRENLVFSKSRAQEFLHMLSHSGSSFDLLLEQEPLSFFRTLSAKLKRYSLVKELKPKNYFQTIPIVEEELSKVNPDWSLVRRLILSCRNVERLALQNKLKALLKGGRVVDFHHIAGSLLGVKKTALAVGEVEDPSDLGHTITLQKSINFSAENMLNSSIRTLRNYLL